LEKQVREKTLEVVKAEKLSTIGELASSLGHDLRNPLTVIKSTFDIMKVKSKDKMDQNTLQHYELIDHALSRIIQMVTDMLNFVRVSPLKTEDHSITSIIKSVTSKIQVPDTIKINLPDNDIIIKCDSKKLEIVFVNLITNAIEAIESKGQIDIRLIDKNDYVLINIEDSGQEIPENILPKIFDPLFTTKQSGTGLGLPSCKNMIEQHSGIITVKTNPTIFTIKLPKDPSQTKFLI
jgi:two-component system sensor histidine kinase HydH